MRKYKQENEQISVLEETVSTIKTEIRELTTNAKESGSLTVRRESESGEDQCEVLSK